jgi:hypothetical protein
VCRDKNVDEVKLKKAKPADDCPDVARRDGSVRARAMESLRSQSDPARLG